MRAAIDEGDGDYKGVKVSKAEAFSLQSDSADLHSATDSATTNQADADEAVSLDTGFADRNREPSAFGYSTPFLSSIYNAYGTPLADYCLVYLQEILARILTRAHYMTTFLI